MVVPIDTSDLTNSFPYLGHWGVDVQATNKISPGSYSCLILHAFGDSSRSAVCYFVSN